MSDPKQPKLLAELTDAELTAKLATATAEHQAARARVVEIQNVISGRATKAKAEADVKSMSKEQRAATRTALDATDKK